MNQNSLEQALMHAIQHHQNGNLEQAQEIYRSILKVMPNEVNSLHFLGMATHQAGDSSGGIELMERSIALSPRSSFYNNLSKVLVEVGRIEHASSALSRALELEPNNADAYNNLGVLLKVQKRFDESAAAFEKAIALSPRHADAYSNLGDLYMRQERNAESAPYFCKAIELNPSHIGAKKRLGLVYYALGEVDKAADIYKQWLAQEPDSAIARHHLAACTNTSVPTRAEDAYIEHTFDIFADSFDAQLEQLDYKGPQLLTEALRRKCGTASKQFAILDAGCGTGLCGPQIIPYASHLTGVDLSGGMLAKAEARNIYDVLIKAELTAYLQAQTKVFDVIFSADTFNYFGALEDLFAAVRGALRDDGYLFFTIESHSDDSIEENPTTTYRINPHGRYSHTDSYLRSALSNAGFNEISIEDAIIRYECGNPAYGFTVSCRAL